MDRKAAATNWPSGQRGKSRHAINGPGMTAIRMRYRPGKRFFQCPRKWDRCDGFCAPRRQDRSPPSGHRIRGKPDSFSWERCF